jgi:Na+(H+)/acetate symporter ActP
MGKTDRTIRVILALVIAILYLTGQITGTAALVLAIAAVAFILTSAVGFCPAYYPFKLSTKKNQS